MLKYSAWLFYCQPEPAFFKNPYFWCSLGKAFPAADILSTILTTAMLVPTLRKLDIHPIRDWFANTSVGTS